MLLSDNEDMDLHDALQKTKSLDWLTNLFSKVSFIFEFLIYSIFI